MPTGRSRSSFGWTARPCARDAAEPAFDEGAKSFFERDWPDWLTGRIFDVDKGGEA